MLLQPKQLTVALPILKPRPHAVPAPPLPPHLASCLSTPRPAAPAHVHIPQGPAFEPTAAARQQLGAEKPAVLQRMDDTLTRCRAARDNRNYRLNSLGAWGVEEPPGSGSRSWGAIIRAVVTACVASMSAACANHVGACQATY